MKVRIEFDDSLDQVEVIIKASQLGPEIEQIQQVLGRLNRPSLVFYKGTSEFFLKLEDLLFFETDGNKTIGHTRDDAYEVKMKLYELEDCLPAYFCRVSKSTIANARAVYSLDKSFSGTSRISFFAGNILGSSLVFTLFKKTSMVTLEVAATFSLLGVFVGMLTHQLPLNLFFLATMGIGFGASGPKFNAKFVNSMPVEQLETIGGGVSTYFMSGQALLRLVVSGLVLLLSVDQISWIFLSASGFLVLYCYLQAYQKSKNTSKSVCIG